MKTLADFAHWQSIESIPSQKVLATGYVLERLSLKRLAITTEIIEPNHNFDWVVSSSRHPFEPLAWLSLLPEPSSDLSIEQPQPMGPAKYKTGEVAGYYLQSGGIAPVTIGRVIAWPSGWWYEFEPIDKSGQVNGLPIVGCGMLKWNAADRLVQRPGRECELVPWELDWRDCDQQKKSLA